MGYVGGINLYTYVGNNSINAVDPLGLYTLIIHGMSIGTPHKPGYSGQIGKILESAGETVKEVIWTGNPAEKNISLKIQNEIKQAAQIAKARGEPLNIIGHSWGGVLASSALRETHIRVDNFVTLGTPYFNFSRPGGVVRYANIISKGDIFGLLSIFNLTAKQIGATSDFESLIDIHQSYWNDPEVINTILRMFGLDKGKKK